MALVLTLYLQRESILSKSYNPALQGKLFRLRQETDCVSNVLYDQLYCVGQLQQYIGRGIVKSPRSFQRERETYIIREWMSSIQAKIANFPKIRKDTIGLAIWVSHKFDFPLPLPSFRCELICAISIQNTSRIDLNKSRQDTAVYILTAVAVAFCHYLSAHLFSCWSPQTCNIRTDMYGLSRLELYSSITYFWACSFW